MADKKGGWTLPILVVAALVLLGGGKQAAAETGSPPVGEKATIGRVLITAKYPDGKPYPNLQVRYVTTQNPNFIDRTVAGVASEWVTTDGNGSATMFVTDPDLFSKIMDIYILGEGVYAESNPSTPVLKGNFQLPDAGGTRDVMITV